MKSRWVSWKGNRVLHCDFAGFGRDAESLRREVEAADAIICREPPGSVLALADLTGTSTSSAVVDIFKHSATLTEPYIARQAVVGVGGIQRFLAQMVARLSGQAMRLFAAEDEAMDWLVGERSDVGEAIGPT